MKYTANENVTPTEVTLYDDNDVPFASFTVEHDGFNEVSLQSEAGDEILSDWNFSHDLSEIDNIIERLQALRKEFEKRIPKKKKKK